MPINDVSFKASIAQADLPAVNTDLYTAPALTTSEILSCIFSNKTAGSVNVTVDIVKASTTVLNVLTSAPIPVGSALDIVVNKPITLAAGDKIRAKASAAVSIDVSGSILETT